MKYAFEKKNFKNSPHMHDWPLKKLMRHYHVTRETMVREFFPLIGRKTHSEIIAEKQLEITNHPMFGKKGERAPISAKKFADMLDISHEWASKLRRKMGVLPVSASYDGRNGLPGVFSGKGGKQRGPYQLSDRERAVYKQISICNNWGRPEGLDEHLRECGR